MSCLEICLGFMRYALHEHRFVTIVFSTTRLMTGTTSLHVMFCVVFYSTKGAYSGLGVQVL